MLPNPSYILDILPGYEAAWIGGLSEVSNLSDLGGEKGKPSPMLSVAPMEGHSGRAVLHVHGGLYGWSYEYIKFILDRWDANENIEEIIMNYDSPGGLASGCQECVEDIQRIKTPIHAHVSGMAASAAYWLATAALDISVKNDSVLGSVGTVITHVDLSKRLEQAGIKVSFITAGEGKVDGNSYQPLSEAGVAKYQKVVDEHYSAFSSGVSKNRGVPVKVVRDDWKAHIYTGRESLENGMSDGLLGDNSKKTIRRAYAKHRLAPRK